MFLTYENYDYVDKKNIHLREKLIIILIKLLKVLINFQYNVSVALIREFSNIFFSLDVNNTDEEQLIALKFSLTKWIILISPMVLT